MAKKRWENHYHTTVVCVDEYTDGIYEGRLMNPGLSKPVAFRGVMQFLLVMEKLLDDMQFPEPFAQTRSFGAQGAFPEEVAAQNTVQGRMATFSLRVLFRQNASWQGSVFWIEGRQEESFRSVLELLLLINSVLMRDGSAQK